ncbi:CKLF-like MARVEL transmembrane domain-containing protein 6 isoform X2 [Zootoca vivipara]|uniref:CKLF-like MARVEL transmembrane domain-containing protein 6 isoform X2 n=1 Tax=Zootoca vivipara TaxID=8524 RepID=UPI001592096D|nr:CKLF-like MARVEL transmembrane domain-containing protein 6 isoform X2 [Zootoca vivipara]
MENGAPVYADTTVPAEQPPGKGPRCTGCTADNLGARRLALKASQLALSFLAFLCEEIVQHCSSCGGLYFFEFVSCSAFLLNIPILVTYCTSLYERTGKEKVATVVFGFLATITFCVDAVLMYLKRRKAEEERKTENPANTLNPTENQPLNN